MRSMKSLGVVLCLIVAAGPGWGSQLAVRDPPLGKAEFVSLLKQASEIRVHSYIPPANTRGMDPGSFSREAVWRIRRGHDQDSWSQLARLRKVPSRIGPGMGLDSLLVVVVNGRRRETGYNRRRGEVHLGREVYAVPGRLRVSIQTAHP
jgi:hypothetical protein